MRRARPCSSRSRSPPCGGGERAGGAHGAPAKPPSDRLVDFSKKPPLVNTLDIDPATQRLPAHDQPRLLADHQDGKTVTPIKGTITDAGKTATVGTFLEIRATGPGQLLGCGHPDKPARCRTSSGCIRSADGGKTWSAVARLGDADLHKIILRHDKLYAFDAVLSAMLISDDGGKTFTEEFTPRGLIIDFEVDPADPKRIIASTEKELFRTEDGGRSWRPLTPAKGIRLAWPDAKTALPRRPDGTISLSSDGGTRWKDVGSVGGEPYELHATGPKACSSCSATARSSRPRMEEPRGAIASGPDRRGASPRSRCATAGATPTRSSAWSAARSRLRLRRTRCR